MIVFNTDLDNTIIFSYKRDIGVNKRCVEIYEGREISFITENTYGLLKQVKEKVLFVPTTTRTMEQYKRIDLGIGVAKYALVCNGGVLLIDGVEDEEWYQESLCLVKDCQEELKKAEEILRIDDNRTFEVRNIRDLFIFTKSDEPEESVEELKTRLDNSLVDIFSNGVKVYVVPKRLSKGIAIRRLREKVRANYVLAAGDSEFDLSMIGEADLFIAPKELEGVSKRQGNSLIVDGKRVFSEDLLDIVLDQTK